ncbi:MAG: hybrid sensor histidine kinase/response regulator [Cellvibrionaceae bacterium]
MSLWLPDDQTLINNPHLLKDSLSRYRRLLQGNGYAFWEWGLHNGTYRCAGSFWEKLGYRSLDESVTSIDNVQEYVHPDDFGFVYNVVLDHLRHDTPIDMVYRIRAADGTYYWTQASASSTRDSSGRVTYLTGVNFDLSHLKETEKALRLSQARHERVLSSSNDGIWEWSATDANTNPKQAGRVGRLHTSHSFWAHLGYNEEEVDALPENERLAIWSSHIHPHDKLSITRALKEYYHTRIPIDMEYRIFGEGGQMFWFRTRGSGIFNTHGRVILMSGINIDITQVKESEERVRKAKEDAERANRSKSNFLSSVSHELRTPLNAILGFSRVLSRDQSIGHEQQENAHYIHEAGDHLLQLINDILDLAQIESGKLSLSMEHFRPAELISECFSYCKDSAAAKNVKLSFFCDGLDNCTINADRIRVKQCVLNLVSNAIKYNLDNGKVDVIFSENNGVLEIAVHDTGPGIPEEKKPYLFEMFNRLGAERSLIEGSGVGLVISRQLAVSMGGGLMYDDQVSSGACFKLSFPMVASLPAQNIKLPRYQDSSVKEINLHFSEVKKLFYIEDNESNIRILESWLKPYSQLILSSQTEPLLGLYEIRKSLPDIVLLDINLPGINGYEILHVLKEDPLTSHLPVIALSASAMAADVEKGLAEGFDEYLTKPLDVDKLSAVFNHFFSKEAA